MAVLSFSFISGDLPIGGLMSMQKESIPPLPLVLKLVRVVREWVTPLPLKKQCKPVRSNDDSDLLERHGITRPKDVPPPPTLPPPTVVSVLRGPLNLPPLEEKSRPIISADDSDLLERHRITRPKDMPPPPTPPPIRVVSAWGKPRPPYEEKSERVPSENGGSKLAGLAQSPITFLRRLIKLVRGFLSRDASGTVEGSLPIKK